MRGFGKKERGAALIIGLIFLVLMSILGLTSMQSVSIQERVTGNATDKYRAIQKAEAVLLIAEENAKVTGFATTNRFIDSGTNEPTYSDSSLWSVCNDDTLSDDKKCEEITSGPFSGTKVKYRDGGEDDTYLVTVWGEGSGTANVIIQSKYQGKLREQQ